MIRVARFLDARTGAVIFGLSLLGFIFGYLLPGAASRLTVFLPVTVFFMIYPVMVTVPLDELSRTLTDFKFLVVIVLLTFIPGALSARGLSSVLFTARPDFAAGLILYSLLPAINALATWVRSGGGNVTRAIAVLAVTQVLATVLLPIGMWLLAGTFVAIDPLMLVQGLVRIVVLPLVLGLLTRSVAQARCGERGVQFLLSVVPPYSVAGMAGTFFLIISRSAHDIVEHVIGDVASVASAGIAVAGVYLFQVLIGIAVARWLHYPYGDGFVVLLGTAAKNTAIGVALATFYFTPMTVMFLVLAFMVQLPLNALLSTRLTYQLRAILSPSIAGRGDGVAPMRSRD